MVAFPTETVYGLGANASDPQALERLYKAKGRPTSHPVIVHIGVADQLTYWAAHVPASALKLAKAFWPGPLTIVLPCADHVLAQVTGGQKTVGLRVPNHPLALSLLKEFGGGIAAPSANKFGRLSPTQRDDVVAEFKDEVAMVLNGGACAVGIESTIIDLSSVVPRILRPGIISRQEIESVLESQLFCPEDKEVTELSEFNNALVRVPGGLPSHYAPRTPLKLISSSDFQSAVNPERRDEVAILSFQERFPGFEDTPWIVAVSEAYIYAKNLYSNLRALDQHKKKLIVVEDVPLGEEWLAIRDRLTRAAAREKVIDLAPPADKRQQNAAFP